MGIRVEVALRDQDAYVDMMIRFKKEMQGCFECRCHFRHLWTIQLSGTINPACSLVWIVMHNIEKHHNHELPL